MPVSAVTTLNEPFTSGSVPPSGWFSNGQGSTTFVAGGVEVSTGGQTADWDSNTTVWTWTVGDFVTCRFWGGDADLFRIDIGYTVSLWHQSGQFHATGGSDVTLDPKPEYFRIVRDTATTFRQYTSPDNATWTQRGVTTYTPPAGGANIRIRIGMGVKRFGQLVGGVLSPDPITVAVNPAVETDTAQPITYLAPITVPVGAALETDTAQPIEYVPPITVAVSPATEVDTAESIEYVPPEPITVTVTPVTETDTALPITAYVSGPPATYVTVTPVTETDTALPLTWTVGTAPPIPPPTGIVLHDTLLVNGVDLQSIPGIMVTDLSGLFAPGTRRGEDDVIPGRRGQVGAQLPFDAYTFSIPVVLLAENADGVANPSARAGRAQFLSNLRALSGLLMGNNGLVTLTRRLSGTNGTYQTHTAAGRFVSGTAFAMLNVSTGTTELMFINLDGAWWNGSAWLVP